MKKIALEVFHVHSKTAFAKEMQNALVIKNITESQNHRMIGAGRDLCGSSSPTLLPKHLAGSKEKSHSSSDVFY